jgi:hypothetical protein
MTWEKFRPLNGQLTELRAGDDGTRLAGGRLDGEWNGGHIHCRFSLADRENEIDRDTSH